MGAEVFEGLNQNELLEQAEMRGMQPLAGESRRDLMERMAAYDNTVTRAGRVAMYGLIDAKRRG